MGGHYNPVLSGILTGHALAQRIRRSALEQEREERAKFQQQRENEETDFRIQTKMAELGGHEATPDDLAEKEIGVTTSPVGLVPSDIGKRMVTAPGGKRYVLPSEAEKTARGDRAFDVQLGRKKKELLAEEQIKDAAAADRLRRTGIKLDPKIAAKVGITGDPLIPLEKLDHVMNAYRSALNIDAKNAPDDPNAVSKLFPPILDNDGNAHLVGVTNSGKPVVTKLGRIGKSKKEAAPPSGGVQGRFDQRELDAAQKQVNGWQDEEQKLHTANIALGQKLSAGEDVDAKGGRVTINKLLAAQITQKIAANKRRIAVLQDRQRRTIAKFGGEQGMPEDEQAGYQPAPQVQPGATVTLKSGQKVVVKKVNSDGTFEY